MPPIRKTVIKLQPTERTGVGRVFEGINAAIGDRVRNRRARTASLVSRASVPPNASTAAPSRTPADMSPSVANGCSRYTDPIYAHPTRTASLANLHRDAVRLLNRRERHGMCGCCDEQGKSYGDQPNHLLLSMLQLSGWVAIPIKID